MSWWAILIGAPGDLAIILIGWRYIVRPRLERYIRQIAREEIANLTGAC